MPPMKPPLLAALALGAACAAPTMPTTEAARLARAERAFAAQSVREGMRAAFLAHFAADGLLVRDGWVAAIPRLERAPDAPIFLDWRPAFVAVAAAGDLGLSTGPWRMRSRARSPAPERHGQFVSVWQRTAHGRWEVVADFGIGHPGPAPDPGPVQLVAPAGGSAGEDLARAEERFQAAARSAGLEAAYGAAASARLRCYREGALPALGEEGARLCARGEVPRAWRMARLRTARSGDFGYALGTWAASHGRGGRFLRVWRAEEGRWRILADVGDAAGASP